MSEAAEVFNPEFNPGGVEGAVDTNILPWIPVRWGQRYEY